MRAAARPSIAVIIPNWNDSRFLPRCLHSVLGEPEGADEVIVVDDKSTDESVKVARSLIEGHHNAQLLENAANKGVYGALDEGLKRSRSEYVVFLAANDFLLPGMFAHARSCLARWPGAGLWSALAWVVDEHGRPLRLHPSPVVALRDAHLSPQRCIALANRVGNWFIGTTLIYRRDAVDAAGRFNPRYMGLADHLTALIVASRHGAVFSPEPYGVVRQHAHSHLEKTLSDLARLEVIVGGIAADGVRSAPQLFEPAFIERTLRRFRAACIRTSGGAALGEVVALSHGAMRITLGLIERLSPRLRRTRIALAFLVLRPFDLAPMLWYRLLGWVYVRARARWPG
jgi:glycosyl transferase family 2